MKISLTVIFLFLLNMHIFNTVAQTINAEGCSCASIAKTIASNHTFIAENQPKTEQFKNQLISQSEWIRNLANTPLTNNAACKKAQLQIKQQNISRVLQSLSKQYDGIYEFETSMNDLCSLRQALTSDKLIDDSVRVTVRIENRSMRVNNIILTYSQYKKYIILLKKADQFNMPPDSKEYRIVFQW